MKEIRKQSEFYKKLAEELIEKHPLMVHLKAAKQSAGLKFFTWNQTEKNKVNSVQSMQTVRKFLHPNAGPLTQILSSQFIFRMLQDLQKSRKSYLCFMNLCTSALNMTNRVSLHLLLCHILFRISATY